MDIIISGKNLVMTPSMRAVIERKLGRLERFWQRLIRMHVEISINRHHRRGDVFVAYGWVESPGDDLRASAEGESFAAAVDVLYAKLERLVVKAKERSVRI
ncbi:MAG: ribosome-associated translation inhibitor RaiA [Candidatus Kerfeldbacteria bacterium]|nr:ribosome-associated translation inhibitor RaiA [Candidatus Kerfeldbacteria bacterium]